MTGLIIWRMKAFENVPFEVGKSAIYVECWTTARCR